MGAITYRGNVAALHYHQVDNGIQKEPDWSSRAKLEIY